MVRLKEIRQIIRDIEREISIPYGAIKSHSVIFRARERYSISIPYGAIKSFAFYFFVCRLW